VDLSRRAFDRAAEAGDLEATARALRERIRGGLARERVVLAALVGHEASRLAVAFEGPAPEPAVVDRVERALIGAPLAEVAAWGLDVAERGSVRLGPPAAPLLALLPLARAVTDPPSAAALQAVRLGPEVRDALRAIERSDPQRFAVRPDRRPERVVAHALDLTLWRWLQPAVLRDQAAQVSRGAAAAGLATFEWQLAAIVERLLSPGGA